MIDMIEEKEKKEEIVKREDVIRNVIINQNNS